MWNDFALIFLSFWVTSRSFQYLRYVAPNGKVTDKRWIGKDVEGSGRALIETLSLHLPDRTEENHEHYKWK
jgi:hypothetical protein